MVPKNTDDVQLHAIKGEHHNHVLGTPEDSHICDVKKVENTKLKMENGCF